MNWGHRLPPLAAWGNCLITLVLLTLPATPSAAPAQNGPSPEKRDDESKDRLIRKAQGRGEEDIMTSIIRRMEQVKNRLEENFDPGPRTQQLQDNILEQLDEAIEMARQNLRSRSTASSPEGDKRESGETSDSDSSDQAQPGDAADNGMTGAGGDRVETGQAGALHERQRQWGNLPPRAREEVLQGIGEDVLEKYREQINRYYEALSQPQP